MKRLMGVVLGMFVAGALCAQPVTHAEASAMLSKAGQAIKVFSDGKVATFAPKFGSDVKPMTRVELIREFDRMFEAVRPNFKFTPKKVAFDAAVLKPGRDAALRKSLEKLVSWGCVARLGPVAVGPSEGLEPDEFGDALGFLLVRLADLSHTPHSRWTPSMMKIGG